MTIQKKQPSPKPRMPNPVRKQEDLDLKQRLLGSPELFVDDKTSDAYLDRLVLKIRLLGGHEFLLSDYVADIMAEYESKFSKAWFYRLADLYHVDRSLMDPYVKPEFVRLFIINFVYARFDQLVLRSLRSRNRKTSTEKNRTKLFQHLTKSASEQLDVVIEQVFVMMPTCKDSQEFKLKYSSTYKVYFQLDLCL